MLATFSNITSAAFSLRLRYVCFIFAECEQYAQLNPLRMLHIIYFSHDIMLQLLCIIMLQLLMYHHVTIMYHHVAYISSYVIMLLLQLLCVIMFRTLIPKGVTQKYIS